MALPPGSFLQATAAGEEALARLVASHVGNAKTIADLFCGVGPFALRLAERARIVAFDADADAIAALKQAANMTPGLKPIEAETRDLFRRPLVAPELKRVDAVVFDPPRQGAEAQARELAKSAVAVVVAVSCNPATFARDVRILIDGGYRLTAVTPVDQFRHSAHVEIVAGWTTLIQIGSASAIIDARCNSACSCAGARRISSSPSRTEFSTTMRQRS